jgi:hypothetical protein
MAPETSKLDVPARLKDVELIERVLRPKIAGEALDDDVAHLFHYADLYSATPEELVVDHPRGPRNNWYFLSHEHYRGGRKLLRRHHHGGWWRPCTRMEVVGDNGLVGYRRYNFYMVNKVKTKWVMIEYSVPQDQQEEGEELVLCKMRKYGRHSRRVRARTV